MIVDIWWSKVGRHSNTWRFLSEMDYTGEVLERARQACILSKLKKMDRLWIFPQNRACKMYSAYQLENKHIIEVKWNMRVQNIQTYAT